MNQALHAFLDPVTIHQDYGWFLSFLLWGTALLRWRVQVGPARPHGWLAVVAAAQVAGAVVEVAHFLTFPASFTSPPRFWEWAAWILAAVQVSAVATLIGTRVASLTAVVAAGLVAWQLAQPLVLGQEWPVGAGLGLAGLAVGLGLWAAFRVGRRVAAGVVVAVVAGLVVSPNGALAELAAEARRWLPLSLFCLPAMAASVIGGFLAHAVLSGLELRETWWAPDRRQLHGRMAAWLAAGLVLAVISGVIARRNFETSLRARAQLIARLTDAAALERWVRDEFRVGAAEVRGYSYFRQWVSIYAAPAVDSPTVAPIVDFVGQARDVSPDLRSVYVSLLHGDEILYVLMKRSAHDPKGVVVRAGPASAADRASWEGGQLQFVPPYVGPRGAMVTVRQPLIGPAGRTVGWLCLDVTVARWTAMQGQAHALVLITVALGVGLLLLAERHRRDRAERDAAETAAEIARAADQAKSAFLAQVSHELRTPIQSLMGYGELLRDSPLNAQQRRWLDAQNAHGELLQRLVNDLLDTLSLQTGSFRLQPQAGDLAGVVGAASETLRARAERRGLTLSFATAGVVPGPLLFDAARVGQVVQNLVGNAIKFTATGGITVRLEVTPRAGAAHCVLAVEDTGPGIPAEQQARLFKPFVRLAGTAQLEGAGLGLAISRHLCRAMGGDLTVTSDGRTGATFFASWQLPMAAAGAAAPAAPAAQAPLEGLRVLVADDNALVRELFVEALTREGALVAEAVDGAEVLARAQPGAFDAIIMDFAMPLLSGEAAARRIRERDPGVRIIGVSAHADGRDRTRALAAGMDDFLPKPVKLAVLRAALRPGVAPADEAVESRLGDLLAKLHRDFVAGSAGALAELEQAWGARDWRRMARGAHHLKGSADLLGQAALAAACSALYAAAEGHKEAAAAAALTDIRRRIAAIRAEDERPALA